ncbi:prenyltransferase [Methanofollis fontis]|nr:prenyltransferase [Methanofollis fontis]
MVPPDAPSIPALIRMARLPFLPGGILLFFFGVLCAAWNGAAVQIDLLLLPLLVLLTGQASVSFSNDYFDRQSDRKGMQTPLSGGSGVLLVRPDLAGAARRIALLLIAVSVLSAAVCVVFTAIPPVFFPFAVAGALTGWYYTAPPLSLAYRGMGEAATMTAFGLFMPGAGYIAAAGELNAGFAVIMLPLLCLGLFFILTVELPDLECDRAVEKWTYVARNGRKNAYRLIASTAAAGSGLFLAGAAVSLIYPAIAAASLLPLAVGIAGLRSPDHRGNAIAAAKLNMAALKAFLLLSCIALAVSLL